MNLYGFVSNSPVDRFDLLGWSDDMVPAGPAPAHIIGKCEYYTWRYKDFEKRNENTCYKPPTYYKEYGLKYCERFRDETRPILSQVGQHWSDLAAEYLQIYMEDKIVGKLIEYDDSAFTEMAFNTHVPAYWDAGFHELSFLDKIYVSMTPDFDEWMKSATGDYTRMQALLMARNEIAKYIVTPGDIQLDTIEATYDIFRLVTGDGPIDRLDWQSAPCQ